MAMEEKKKKKLIKGAKVTGIAAEIIFIPYIILPFVLLFQWLFARRFRLNKWKKASMEKANVNDDGSNPNRGE